MIPLRLSLHNFMSYRDPGQDLDLAGLHVVCLCGDNGHGKSALLDAVTWALWGAARGQAAGTRSLRTEELVHLGQTDMEVALEFLADDTRYRVVRKYSRRPSGPGAGGSLDLQVANSPSPLMGEGGETTSPSDKPTYAWRSISESSATATQEKINRVLRMDYKTFVNTAFLLQGKADLFMRADPADRKKVLAEILDLGLYDRLTDRSKQLAGAAASQLVRIETEAQRLDADLVTRPQAQAEAQLAQQALDGLTSQLAEADRRLDAVRARLAEMDATAREAQRLQAEADRLRAYVHDEVQRLALLDARRDAYEQAIARRDEVLAQEAALLETRRRLADLDSLATRHYHLQDRVALHQRAVEVGRTRLEQEVVNAERRLADLQARADTAEVHQRALYDAVAQLAAVETDAARLLERKASLQSLRDEAQRLEAEAKNITAELEKLRTQLRLVSSDTAPVCPVCKTPLGPEGRAHLQQEITEQGKALRARYDQGQTALKDARSQTHVLAAQVERDEASLRRRREDTLRLQERAARSLEDAAAAKQEAASAQTVLDALRARLAAGDYVPQDQAALRQLQEEQAALGYDALAHQQARSRVATLEPAAEAARSLREAEQRLPAVLEECGSLRRRLAEARTALATSERDAARLAEALQARPALAGQSASLTRDREDLRRQQRDAQESLARANARLADLAEKAARKRELEHSGRALRESRETSDELSDAFGRNGLQAMLIEEAIPDLETDANELLARLSDGRMTLKVETQRATKRGGSQDTLDLKVSDELGTRSYDLFSGGEAFRVNFALRVALAQLLSRRAGAPLRTLFVDEGFGTQDVAGRERLVEAIQAIQGSFDLIVVITHLEEVKEAFPVRIEVTKDERGSACSLVS